MHEILSVDDNFVLMIQPVMEGGSLKDLIYKSGALKVNRYIIPLGIHGYTRGHGCTEGMDVPEGHGYTRGRGHGYT